MKTLKCQVISNLILQLTVKDKHQTFSKESQLLAIRIKFQPNKELNKSNDQLNKLLNLMPLNQRQKHNNNNHKLNNNNSNLNNNRAKYHQSKITKVHNKIYHLNKKKIHITPMKISINKMNNKTTMNQVK